MVHLMIGPSGSGKSTYANKLQGIMDDCIVLSSDGFRGIIGKDESDQTVNKRVFEWIRDTLCYFCSRTPNLTSNIIIDATNLTKEARRPYIYTGAKYKHLVVANYITTPLDDCLIRNFNRTRKVPEHAIRRQFNQLQPPEQSEGFSAIYNIKE